MSSLLKRANLSRLQFCMTAVALIAVILGIPLAIRSLASNPDIVQLVSVQVNGEELGYGGTCQDLAYRTGESTFEIVVNIGGGVTGTWQYSTDGGVTWTTVTPISGRLTLPTGGTITIRFTPVNGAPWQAIIVTRPIAPSDQQNALETFTISNTGYGALAAKKAPLGYQGLAGGGGTGPLFLMKSPVTGSYFIDLSIGVKAGSGYSPQDYSYRIFSGFNLPQEFPTGGVVGGSQQAPPPFSLVPDGTETVPLPVIEADFPASGTISAELIPQDHGDGPFVVQIIPKLTTGGGADASMVFAENTALGYSTCSSCSSCVVPQFSLQDTPVTIPIGGSGGYDPATSDGSPESAPRHSACDADGKLTFDIPSLYDPTASEVSNPGVPGVGLLAPKGAYGVTNVNGVITVTGERKFVIEPLPSSEGNPTTDPNRFQVTGVTEPGSGRTVFLTLQVEKVTENNITTLLIKEYRGTTSTTPKVHRYRKTTLNATVSAVLVSHDGSRELRREFTPGGIGSPTTWTERRKVLEAPTAGGNVVEIQDEMLKFRRYSGGVARMDQRIVDPNGRALRTSNFYYEAGQSSGGTLGTSVIGSGRLSRLQRFDGNNLKAEYTLGNQRITTPYADNPKGTVSHIQAAKNTLAGATSAIGGAVSQAGTGNKILLLRSRSLAGAGQGTSSIAAEGQQWGGSAVISGRGGGATVRSYLSAGDPQAPRRLARLLEPSGRLTTWEYKYSGGLKTVVKEIGEPNAAKTAVAKGERVTTTSMTCQRVLSEVTEGSDDLQGEGDAVFLTSRHTAPTEFDALGRPTAIHYNSEGSVDMETFTYACCGVETHTDRRGGSSTYAYDSLGRVHTTTVKRSPGGPATVFESVRSGLSLTNKRAGISVSAFTYNKAGELTASSAADEDGDGTMESTSYSYTYASTGTTVQSTGPLGTIAYTAHHPDGKSKAIWGNSVADQVTRRTTGPAASPYAEVVTEYHLRNTYDPATGSTSGAREWTATGYDSHGRLVAKWNAATPTSKATWSYNAATGLLDSTADADGVAVTYLYHPDGSTHHASREITNGRIRVTTREYSFEDNDLLSADSGRGSRVEKTYLHTNTNAVTGLTPAQVSKIRGDGYVSRYETAATGVSLSAASLPSAADQALGKWTVTTISPDQTKQESTYADGLLDTVKSFNSSGIVVWWTAYDYDNIGRVLSREDSRTGVTSYDSDANGSPEITASGNVTYIREPSDAGHPARIIRFTYDKLGRRTKVTHPDNTFTEASYYLTGAVQAVWGAQVYPHRFSYDEPGRRSMLETWRNPAAGANFTTATGADKTSWFYDNGGNLSAKRDDQNRQIDYLFSPAGRLMERTSARTVTGQTYRVKTQYIRDEGFVEQIHYNDGATADVFQQFDAYGRLESATQGGNAWGYHYDPSTWTLDRESVVYDLNADGTPELSRTIRHGADAPNGGRPTEFRLGVNTDQDPATIESVEHLVSYHYDDSGRLSGIDGTDLPQNGRPHAFNYGYVSNSLSMIESVAGPLHEVVNAWEVHRDILLSKTNQTGSPANPFAKFNYNIPDASGNPTGMGADIIANRRNLAETGTNVVGPASRGWEYGTHGDLTVENASGEAYDRGYVYDAIGNRTLGAAGTTNPSQAPPGSKGLYKDAPNGTAGADSLNQYGEVTTPGSAAVSLAYDGDGNMTSGPLPAHPGEASDLGWDAEDQLVSAVVGDAATEVTFRYDPVGRRIAKHGGGIAELYIYDGWNLVATYRLSVSGSYQLSTAYTWGLDIDGGLQSAGGVGGLLAIHEKAGNGRAKAGQVIYPAYDGNGNITRLLGPGGTVVASYAYDAFGNFVNYSASNTDNSGYASQQEFGFSTKFRDSVTGLYYYGRRYYDPATGRWLSRDPATEAGGLNLYGMLGNDPVNATDLLGLLQVGGGDISLAECLCKLGAGVGKAAVDEILGMITSLDPRQFGELIEAFKEMGRAIESGEMSWGEVLKEIGLGLIASDEARWAINSIMNGTGDPGDTCYNIGYGLTPILAKLVGGGGAGVAAALHKLESIIGKFRTLKKEIKAAEQAAEKARELEKKIGIACFVAGTQIATADGGRPIESLKVGDRVLTTDGDSDTDVSSDAWRKVTLVMPNPEQPQDVLEIVLLRPIDWISATGCRAGTPFWFELEEMGLRGWAEVTSVNECPAIASGHGRVVLVRCARFLDQQPSKISHR